MQSTHNKQLRRKRDVYRRSQTLAALPASLSHLQPRSITQQQQQQCIELVSVAAPSQSQPVLTRSSSRTSRSSVSSMSAEPALPQQSTAGRTAPQRRLLGRTPSSPSVLLSRMRDLIREKVVETTVDRSDLAAVERERRQRAADAYVESLRRRQQQQQHRHSSDPVDITTGLALSSSVARRSAGARRHRTRSDPASSWLQRLSPGPETLAGEIPLQSIGRSTDVPKNAFREYRSISEDTSSHRHGTTATICTTRRLSHDVALDPRSKG